MGSIRSPPECLYIDYAKEAYRAPNKSDYTIQMTCWLRQQASVDRFAWYIDWCKAGRYHTDPPSQADEDDDTSVSIASHSPASPEATSTLVTVSQTPAQAFCISAWHPVNLRGVSAMKINCGHNASQFLEALKLYIHQHGSVMDPQPFDTFDLYQCVTVELPAIPEASNKKLKNVI